MNELYGIFSGQLQVIWDTLYCRVQPERSQTPISPIPGNKTPQYIELKTDQSNVTPGIRFEVNNIPSRKPDIFYFQSSAKKVLSNNEWIFCPFVAQRIDPEEKSDEFLGVFVVFET